MCDFCEDIDQKIGILLKRNNYLQPRIKDIRIELQVQIFEIDIIKKAIESFLSHKYKKFDALVGDCKCQVRVSMLLDIVQENKLNKNQLYKINENLNNLKTRLLNLVEKIEKNKILEIKEILETNKHNLSMNDFLKNYNLNYNLEHDLIILQLSFFSYFNFHKIVQISNNILSNSKAKELLQLAKKHLSLITVDYEQELAKVYGSEELRKVLEIVETKGFVSMTAFFPSLKPILEKIKQKKQLISKKTVYICDCYGIKDIQSELFRADENNKFKESKLENFNEAAFVIEGYQFNGSFEKLSENIKFSSENSLIQVNDFSLCTCQKSLNVPVVENIEEAILSNAAHHKQFTNGAEIPWADLGLENSELKKEYDYLRTLSGYGINDMSKFCIVHIYASTVGQELEDQRELLMKLGKK